MSAGYGLKITRYLIVSGISVLWIICLYAQIEPESRILKRETQIKIQDENKVIISEFQEILIARKADVPLAYNSLRETDFVELMSMDAVIYDLSGQVIKELKKKELERSSVSFYSLYNAHNTIFYKLSHPVVPYLVKKEIKYRIKSSFFTPQWNPQERFPVDYARLEIILEKPLEYNFKTIGDIGEPEITKNPDGSERYVWEIRNIPKYVDEYRRAPESQFQMGIICRAVKFNLDGFRGSADSWHSFGSWYHNLVKDQIEFSPGINVGESYKSIMDPKERVKQIYRKLQDETRYIQVYLGIDGWRPHHVDKIHQVKYGDCKDLSAYMVAMLKQAGIEGFPALARTRNTGIVDKDLPGNQFNHMIAVVPLPDDTLYLECTSKAASVDDLPEYIEGIHILLIKPDQSTLITTPLSTAEMNQSVLNATARIMPDRSLDLEGRITLSGNRAIEMREELKDMQQDKKKEWLTHNLSRKSGDVKIISFSINNLDNPNSDLFINFQANLQYFAQKAGSRLVFEPGIFHKVAFKGEKPADRKMPLLNSSVYMNRDSIRFVFPEGFLVKNEARADSITAVFGSYRMNLSREDNGALWTSDFTINSRYVSLMSMRIITILWNRAKRRRNIK
jgi:hypothetical protein